MTQIFLLDLLHKSFLFVNSFTLSLSKGAQTVVSSKKYTLRQAQSERKRLLQEVYCCFLSVKICVICGFEIVCHLSGAAC